MRGEASGTTSVHVEGRVNKEYSREPAVTGEKKNEKRNEEMWREGTG